MRFDPALAAQTALQSAEAELGADWANALELEDRFSSNAGLTAREAYEALLDLARRHPLAHNFQAFCIYITWQQVTEQTIPHFFKIGVQLCEAYLASHEGKAPRDIEQILELSGSFRAGLGMEEEDEMQREFGRDTPKGGD